MYKCLPQFIYHISVPAFLRHNSNPRSVSAINFLSHEFLYFCCVLNFFEYRREDQTRMPITRRKTLFEVDQCLRAINLCLQMLSD